MDDDDTRRLLNAKLTTRGKEKGALVELLYPTIYKLSCLLDLSSSSINELREEKITLGITTLLSMSILIFMVSDKMPSTSSFIPLIVISPRTMQRNMAELEYDWDSNSVDKERYVYAVLRKSRYREKEEYEAVAAFIRTW
ncbi:hypothetical protein RB195_017103 [Necator americanus]|uniref:Neurotransmitter-gated ion-channel transmembrane domain-containing protein n=1 Tax=Necator americanus TaxID=51031 RepID=A0ABR1C622_NECAM